jgi:formate dehydrogenase assembly factor FdhD
LIIRRYSSRVTRDATFNCSDDLMRQAIPASQQYPMSRREVSAKELFAVLKTVRAAHERTKDTGLSHAAAVIESVLEEKLSNAHSYSVH